MNHPEILVIPALMLADYTLTILGAKSSAEVYRKHFVVSSYEMNPLWRESIDQIRWFNPRHFALVVLVTLLLLVADHFFFPAEVMEVALGMLFGAFGSVCGRHLTNLMLFRYLNRHSQEISGEVHLSMKLMLKMSQFSYFGTIPLFAVVAALAPNRYTVGIVLGVTVLAGVHSLWARKTPPVVGS